MGLGAYARRWSLDYLGMMFDDRNGRREEGVEECGGEVCGQSAKCL